MFKLIAHKGKNVIEFHGTVETVIDTVNEAVVHFIYLPGLDAFPSPFLEDVFHTVNTELRERDKREIPEKF